MRVLLDCRMASWTGVGRYTVGLTRALARRANVELVLVVAEPDALLADLGQTIVAAGEPFSVTGMRELSRASESSRADVIHCLHFPTPWPTRGPLAVTLHDLTPLLLDGVMPNPVKRAVYRLLNQRAVRIADAIVCPSSNTARDVTRVFPDARSKVAVVLEAAEDFAEGPRAALEGELGRVAAGPYVLAMGSTRAHKDLPTLLEAFARIASHHPDLRVLLAGEGPRGYIDTVGRERGLALQERVSFTGRITDAELRTLYAEAAVFAFPSRYEGFGLPPLEAMALGTPVVAARAASVPEVVGDAALLFEPGDAEAMATLIERVLTDDALRTRLVAAGLARSGELTWDKAAELTVQVYDRIVDGRGGSRAR